jgi:hypothetical protein
METPESMRPQLTGGNIRNVSYNVLCGYKITHRNERFIFLLDTYAVTRLSFDVSS